MLSVRTLESVTERRKTARCIAIVGNDSLIKRMFVRAGWDTDTYNSKLAPEVMTHLWDAVCFTGGSDVNPALYGERPHHLTSFSAVRDAYEVEAFNRIPAQLFKIGICRGGQFLNVLSGGRLWQNVDGHTGTHPATDMETQKTIQVTSTHHQMMRPTPKAQILTTARCSRRRESFNTVMDRPTDYDIECVFYPDTKSLCFQPHPEYGNTECRDYFFELLNRFKEVA